MQSFDDVSLIKLIYQLGTSETIKNIYLVQYTRAPVLLLVTHIFTSLLSACLNAVK